MGYKAMTFKDIYKTVKPSLVKEGVTYKMYKTLTIYKPLIEAYAWQYAHQVMKDKPITKALKSDGSAKSITPKWLKDSERYNEMFMGHYTKAMKVLRKEVKQ
jgi:hypothetical protein